MTHTRIVDQVFAIVPEQQSLALAALQQEVQRKKQRFYQAQNLLAAQSLQELLQLRGFQITTLNEGGYRYPVGTIISLETPEKGVLTFDQDDFFRILAPFVEPGYLECRIVESDEHWRYVFSEKQCQIIYPELHWPTA